MKADEYFDWLGDGVYEVEDLGYVDDLVDWLADAEERLEALVQKYTNMLRDAAEGRTRDGNQDP